jgi:hypothetical protein
VNPPWAEGADGQTDRSDATRQAAPRQEQGGARRTFPIEFGCSYCLELLHTVLESCGAKVLGASTTLHARGYLLTVTPDMIVCDLALPREDRRCWYVWRVTA